MFETTTQFLLFKLINTALVPLFRKDPIGTGIYLRIRAFAIKIIIHLDTGGRTRDIASHG